MSDGINVHSQRESEMLQVMEKTNSLSERSFLGGV
jgi:hypothetical protein